MLASDWFWCTVTLASDWQIGQKNKKMRGRGPQGRSCANEFNFGLFVFWRIKISLVQAQGPMEVANAKWEDWVNTCTSRLLEERFRVAWLYVHWCRLCGHHVILGNGNGVL